MCWLPGLNCHLFVVEGVCRVVLIGQRVNSFSASLSLLQFLNVRTTCERWKERQPSPYRKKGYCVGHMGTCPYSACHKCPIQCPPECQLHRYRLTVPATNTHRQCCRCRCQCCPRAHTSMPHWLPDPDFSAWFEKFCVVELKWPA